MTHTQQLIQLLNDYEQSANNGDADALANLYCEDAILFPDRFEAHEGADRIRAFYSFAFSQLTLDIRFAIHPDKIMVAGNTAYATTTSTGTRLIKATGSMIPENNRELWVFSHLNGEWKIARYCFNKSE